jgi:hypothetical protein
MDSISQSFGELVPRNDENISKLDMLQRLYDRRDLIREKIAKQNKGLDLSYDGINNNYDYLQNILQEIARLEEELGINQPYGPG